MTLRGRSDELRRWYEQYPFATTAETAAHFEVTPAAIRKARSRLDIPADPHGTRPYTREHREAVEDWLRQHPTVTAIHAAKHLGLSREYVTRLRTQLGITHGTPV